ncbi:MAG: aminotransferase class I/II-fold pyridoxal phosphate-dependent enzyme [Agathobacter sp.]|nr:aminotransferase class I/II-fold pyridoxal phosphate-dependent enzyme [Agathobacter sp.]
MNKGTIEPFENKVWLSSPTMHGKELEYVREAYETNWMSTVGRNIDEVEKTIASVIGCKEAVALSSGTAALHMAIKYAAEEIYGKTENGRGALRGQKVFCSDMTFAATVNPIVYECGEPVFVDSEYQTWNMDPVALEKAFELYPEVKLVVVAHLYGTPAQIERICSICKEHEAILIEDAAESFGATYKKKQTGTYGDYSSISFNGNKIITGSSGGAVLSDNANAIATIRKWSTQSREQAVWYQHESLGYNYRMSNVIAGVVRGQLPYLNEHISQKKSIYMRYKKALSDLPLQMNPYIAEESEPNFWLSCILIDKNAMCEQRRTDNTSEYIQEVAKSCPDEILSRIAEINAEGRPIWKPMHMQPLYRDNSFVSVSDETDVGRDIFARGLCLPSDNKMTEEQVDRVAEVVRSCFS